MFNRITITGRAWVVLGVMATASVAATFHQASVVRELNEHYRVIAEERSPGYVALARAQRHFQIVARHLNRMALEAGDAAAQAALWREVEAELGNFQTRNNQFEAGDPGQRAVAEANRRRHAELERVAARVRDALAAGQRDRALEILRREMDPVVDGLRDALRDQVDANVATQAAMAASARQESERALMFQWLEVAAAIALSFLAVMLLLTRGVAAPLGRLTGVAERLAEGAQVEQDSRAAALAARRDEIGRLARAVAALSERATLARQEEAAAAASRAAAESTARAAALQGMAERVEAETRGAVDQVGTRMGGVAAASGRLSEGAARVSSQSGAVAAAAAEALKASEAVAAAAEEMSASIRSVAGQIGSAAEASRSAVAGVENGVATIRGLQEAVGRIGEVARLIADIAAQTNLLALNATIEAARAGDAGKGFAVVAGEVKTLATQTAQRTEDITRQIGLIEAATQQAVEAVRGIADGVGALDQATGSMAEAIAQQSAATEEIARTIAGAAASVRAVEAGIASVAEEARRSGEDAAAMRSAAVEAHEGVGELRQALVRIVRTATVEVDRRREPRHRVVAAAALSLGGRGPVAAELLDLSGGGAALRGPFAQVAPGTPASLLLDGAPVAARVVAVEPDGRLGLRFEEVDARTRAVLDRLIAAAPRAAA